MRERERKEEGHSFMLAEMGSFFFSLSLSSRSTRQKEKHNFALSFLSWTKKKQNSHSLCRSGVPSSAVECEVEGADEEDAPLARGEEEEGGGVGIFFLSVE